MPRLRCPKCDTIVKVSASDTRTSVPCLKCGRKIGLNEMASARKNAGRKREPAWDERYVWMPVLIAAPLAALFMALSFRFDFFGMVSPFFGVMLFVFAFIWGTTFAARDGAHVGYDWMDSSVLRFILMVCGPYWVGYFIYLTFTQIQYAARKPSRYLPVFSLGMTGFLMLLCCPLGNIERDRVEYRRQQERIARQNDPNNPPEPDPRAAPPAPGVVRHTGDATLDKALFELQSKDAAVRDAASERLTNMRPNKHRAAVAGALVTGQQNAATLEIRKANVRPLAAWATRNEAQNVVGILRNPEWDADTRLLALKTLGELKDEGTVPEIVECYKDPKMKAPALAALKAMGPVAEPAVRARLGDGSRDHRVAVFEILKEIGTQASVPTLQQVLRDSVNPDQSTMIREALAAIDARTKK